MDSLHVCVVCVWEGECVSARERERESQMSQTMAGENFNRKYF